MNKTIEALIIEDEEIVGTLACSVTKERGMDPDWCESGEAAVENWGKKKHELVILDLGLPGMSGTEVCEWIRAQENGGDTYILVCTGDSKVETFRNVLTAGANDYIPKPLTPKLLAVRLEIAKAQVEQTRRRQELQREIGRNERRFRLISENSRDLVCTHDPEGKLTYVSPSCVNLLEMSPDELLGKKFDEIKAEEKAETINLRCAKDEENGVLETTHSWEAKTPKGRVWLETYSQSIRGAKNELVEIYSYSRDISEQKHEEAQLKILSVLGTESDTESFLKEMRGEIQERMGGTVIFHIHGRPGEGNSYRIGQNDLPETIVRMHKEIDLATPHDKIIYQWSGAGGIFHKIEGAEALESVVCQPIPGTFGRSIGKITICRDTKLAENERTKAVLFLCAAKIGCVLEEHVMR